MTGLASSRIRLFPHQVEIVSRVERDSVQRYLLADEVGLGKTIEAGIVLRQYLLDHPSQSAVVLAPRLLIPQWRTELVEKFGLDGLGDGRVRYVAHGESDWWRKGFGLLIVDEAHHVVAGFDSPDPSTHSLYEQLRVAAAECPRLLMLSATPLLHNEQSFLAMLHLIDPMLYRLEGSEQFKELVTSRREFARRFQAFTPGANDYVIEEHTEWFREHFGTDEVLAAQLDEIENAIETEDLERMSATVQSARVHLGETYRLHQRVLRTRRSSPLAREFKVRGRLKPDRLILTWAGDRSLHGWLSGWLDLVSIRLAESSSAATTWTCLLGLLDRWQAGPQVLDAYAQALLDTATTPRTCAAITLEEQTAICAARFSARETDHLLDLSAIVGTVSAREDWLSEIADHLVDAPSNSVVFCSYTATAMDVADELDRRLAPHSVSRYMHADLTVDELEREFAMFATGSRPYLICDRAGEEGKNFQFADAAIHVDLPWNPNRLEQRIGRIDRYSDRPPVRSLALLAEGGVEEAWLRLLIDGFGLFDDSIATLQHVLDKKVPAVARRLITQGPSGLAELSTGLREELEEERRAILQLENLESIEAEHIFGRGLYASLQEAESAEVEFERATESWLYGTRDLPESIGLKSNLDRNRQHIRDYYLPRHPAPSMLATRVLEHLGEYLGQEHRYTFRREVAVGNRDVALVRPGEALLDSLEDLTRADDLGQTYAFWRRSPSLDDPQLVTTFTYRVEADLDRGASVLIGTQAGTDRRAALERTVDSFFPPQALTLWQDVSGRTVQDAATLSRLQKGFNRRSDRPLSSSMIPKVEEYFDLDWATWWLRQADLAGAAAEHEARLVKRKGEAVLSAHDAFGYARRQLDLRLQHDASPDSRARTEEELDISASMETAVITAIEGAMAVPEAVGIVLLASESPEELFSIFHE